ncbi:MAG: DUF3817 domain-containing protein [Ferruginibacter sp.]
MSDTSYFKLIQWFRNIGKAEGISFLILLFIAMPLKYFANFPEAVKYFGWVHGLLFVAYGILALEMFGKLKKPFSWLLKAALAAITPFGTFIFDRQFK